MSKVYFKSVASYADTGAVSRSASELLKLLIEKENIALENEIPLKVHFGEKGNDAFITADKYDGIVDFLKERGIKSCFIETNAIYSGSRMTADKHIRLAHEHGFTKLPVLIADGTLGEDYREIEIDAKHFKKCKIASRMVEARQMIVLSHFKGHMLAGFGGAIKQLGMGCAARGGKLEQHIAARPFIIPFFVCKKCGSCLRHCPAGAIKIGFYSRIDGKKCIGCAACIAVCKHNAIFINPFKIQFASKFREKIAEYALAAQKGKKNIYITYAFNIAKGCDCEGHSMKMVAGDVGIFASCDPVAIDLACMDAVDKKEGRKVFGGRDILAYGQKIGLGRNGYELIEA
ncbi:MAG TPA: DUF362 domain-containing protein [Candidatus Wallbacteria bacterium]|nr:DUF362 domain-containing protein [Candidatus Wallbacteria bacterium]